MILCGLAPGFLTIGVFFTDLNRSLLLQVSVWKVIITENEMPDWMENSSYQVQLEVQCLTKWENSLESCGNI